MSPAPRLIAFTAGLAVVGAGATAVGKATEASPPGAASTDDAAAHGRDGSMGGMQMGGSGGSGHHSHGMSMPGMAPAAKGADGTRLSLDGLTLAPVSERVTAGSSGTWRFRILDDTGTPVRRFERDQTKLLHLIVVRDDLTGYQHLHPALASDGTFSVALKLPQPGRYRAIADFTTGHKRYVLGTTLTAPGVSTTVALPAEASTATADGYEVSLTRAPSLKAGTESEMTFGVRRGGQPVTSLQPYLGAYGHLVALHAGDLAYSHVHPTGRDRARGAVTFHAELAKPGAYRLFLQFRAGGRVHTVAFTQNASR